METPQPDAESRRVRQARPADHSATSHVEDPLLPRCVLDVVYQRFPLQQDPDLHPVGRHGESRDVRLFTRFVEQSGDECARGGYPATATAYRPRAAHA